MSCATHDLITLHHVLHATLHTPPLKSGFCGSKLHMIKWLGAILELAYYANFQSSHKYVI